MPPSSFINLASISSRSIGISSAFSKSTFAPAVGGFISSTASRLFSSWSVERDPVPLPKAGDIIDVKKIEDMMESTKEAAKDPVRVREILHLARENALLNTKPGICMTDDDDNEYVQGLNLEQAATLLNIDENGTTSTSRALLKELFNTALGIKRQIYGNRIVLFAPLYLSNWCTNSCTYCSFRSPNKKIHRASLMEDEIVEETEWLQEQGHRRLLLLCGESPRYSFDKFLKHLKLVASVKTEPHGAIRRINVEIPPLSVTDFKKLKDTDVVGTYTVFQETYHPEVYERMHPTDSGKKWDYEYRLTTMDRAMKAGIDDVGIGALFGLTDYRFEVLAMLMHAQHLDRTYHAGPHTVSIPRLQPAEGAPDSDPPHPVTDAAFAKLVAVLRCAVPYTGMILSTRESPAMRNALLQLGISQMSAGSKTEVGSYHKSDYSSDSGRDEGVVEIQEEAPEVDAESGQFSLQDHRSLDEVVQDLMKNGFVPSWCTACYRTGRTGAAFMNIAKKGDIHSFCHPNALLTLQEYLDDYASKKTKQMGEQIVVRERESIPSKPARDQLDKKLELVKAGERDLYF